ncbi:MAG: beta strand repeat-containing protein, partial [Blastocatellia bacterium]
GLTPQAATATGGVAIGSGDFNAQFNVVASNKIGTNVNGSVQLPNLDFGVLLEFDANNNTIGGTSSANLNVISGNGSTVGSSFGPGVIIQDAADNNLIQDNLIGPNSLGTGPPTDLNNPSNPVSNKGGGMIVTGGAFANRIIGNSIAFNSTLGTASGILCDTSGSFNTFSQNLIFLDPANNPPTIPAIQEPGTGQQGLLNTEISAANPPAQTSLIKIDSGTTVTSTGDTTITGTADFNDNGVVGANINNSKVEIFVSQRGSAGTPAPSDLLSEAQAFLGTVTSFQVDPHVLSGNVVDWSAHITIPAPFLNPVQTPVLFLTATITTGDGSTSPLSRGFVPQFVSSGGGGGCSLTAAPTVVNFTNAPVSHTTTQNLVITNTGSTSVTISSATLTQTGTLFALGTLSLPATISPTSTFTIPVSFTPTSTAAASASITIANNCSTLTVPVSGSGTTSSISVIPTSLNFGNVNLGQTATESFTIINFGSGTLNITGLTIASSATTKFTVIANPAPTTVGGLSTLTVNVQFAPTTPGQVTDTLTVASSDVVHPSIAVTLSGTGVSTIPPSVIVNQPSGGQVVAAGSTFTVGFAATGGSLPGTFLVKLSTDGGATFPFSLGGGVATSGINTFSASAPGSVSTSSAVIQVSVTDSSSLTGTGLSGVFTIGTPPVITSAIMKSTGKIKLTATGVVDTASLVIGGESWSLIDNGGGNFVVKAFEAGSLGHFVSAVVPSGATVSITVRNPGGLTSAGFNVTRP